MTLTIVHHPDYQAPLSPDHRFPMSKYGYLRERLVKEGLLQPGGYVAPGPASAALLSMVHDPGYVSRAFALTLSDAEMRRIGLPRTERVIRRARLAAAGTTLAGELALSRGLACNTAGGSHHAAWSGGAGFSTFNDVAAAAAALRARGLVKRVLVLDCDVHQGDGTAQIFAEDPAVFTASLHAAKNYPFEKVQGDLDLGLEDGLDDAAYLKALAGWIRRALDGAGPVDLVFYNAGVDVHAADRLGRLNLSDAGLAARERFVIDTVRDAGLPIATVLGGGYGKDPSQVADRHAAVFRAAAARLSREAAARREEATPRGKAGAPPLDDPNAKTTETEERGGQNAAHLPNIS